MTTGTHPRLPNPPPSFPCKREPIPGSPTHHRRSRDNGNPSPAPQPSTVVPVTTEPAPYSIRGTHPRLPNPANPLILQILIQTIPLFLCALCGENSLLTTTRFSPILEHMSATTTHTTETTERKPPTIADIVREKTGDGRLIIDFFTDVMTGRIEGAELCHRIDAAKQLVKYGSKDAARFIAEYRGVSCGHSTGGRPDPADPCSAEERSLVAVTLSAPATLTRDFLAVLSGIDEFLMARLIRAQTADGGTIIDFLDDVMQDRTDGFKTHHRIAAAKELIVHIVRDEHPSHTPSPSTTPSPLTGEGWGEGDSPVVGADPRVRPLPGSHTPSPSTGEGWGEGDTPAVGADPRVRPLPGSQTPAPSTGEGWGEGDSIVVPAQAGTQGGGGGRSTPANPARTEPVPSTAEGSVHPEPSSPVIPAKAGIQRGGGRNTAANPAHPEPAEGPRDKARRPRTRRTRTQRRRDGNARAAIRRKALGSERIEEGKDEKPAPAELTIAERRIKERLEQHWHEPDPWTGPIDSTHPGRSPP